MFNIKRLLILILTGLFIISISAAAPKILLTQDNATIDKIIQSPDKKKPQSSGNDLQDVMNGFEEETDDDIPEGFEDDAEKIDTAPHIEKDKQSVFSLKGICKLATTINIAHEKPEHGETDWRGLSRLRSELQLDFKIKFLTSWQAFISGKGLFDSVYLIRGRNEFTDDVLDNYEKELELREVYILGSPLERIDIKIGRQIAVWGKSDNIRVTDVLNPLNMREPGITDIEDLRLPVTMTRVDCYIGDWSLSGIALHEIRFNKSPEFGSDFYPVSTPPPEEDKPAHRVINTEYAIALSGIFSGWDMAFYFANIYNDMPHMKLVSLIPSGQLPVEIEMKHARLKMLGSAFNAALGNWLVKAEAAYFNGFKFFNKPGSAYSRMDVLTGIEFSGLKDTTISIEAVNRHILNFDNILGMPFDEANKDEFQSAVRLTRKFLNETLTLTLLASAFGWIGRDGAFQRVSAQYDVTDGVNVIGGFVLYQSGDLARFRNIGSNDRIFFEGRYSF